MLVYTLNVMGLGYRMAHRLRVPSNRTERTTLTEFVLKFTSTPVLRFFMAKPSNRFNITFGDAEFIPLFSNNTVTVRK